MVSGSRPRFGPPVCSLTLFDWFHAEVVPHGGAAFSSGRGGPLCVFTPTSPNALRGEIETALG